MFTSRYSAEISFTNMIKEHFSVTDFNNFNKTKLLEQAEQDIPSFKLDLQKAKEEGHNILEMTSKYIIDFFMGLTIFLRLKMKTEIL